LKKSKLQKSGRRKKRPAQSKGGEKSKPNFQEKGRFNVAEGARKGLFFQKRKKVTFSTEKKNGLGWWAPAPERRQKEIKVSQAKGGGCGRDKKKKKPGRESKTGKTDWQKLGFGPFGFTLAKWGAKKDGGGEALG